MLDHLVTTLARRKAVFVATTLSALAASICAIRFGPRTFEAVAVLQANEPAARLIDDSVIAGAAANLHIDANANWWDRLFTTTGQSAVSAVMQNLRVDESGHRKITIRYSSRDPQLAADLVNALADACVRRGAVARRAAADVQMRNLRTRASEVETELARDRAALRSRADDSDLLKDRIEANRRIYAGLLERMNQAAMADGPEVRIVSAAQPPLEPYRPDVSFQFAFACIGALLFGVIVAIARDKTDARIRAPEDAAGPLLGAIPPVAFGDSAGMDAPPAERIAWEAKDSEASESIRSVLASILASPECRDLRTLVITSPHASEGKTTVASNLAIGLAEIQRRVLIIDADLRRPRLHAIFEVANTSGLGDLLCASQSVLDLPPEQLVRKTEIPNLFLLSSGPATDGIFNRLYSTRMSQLVARFAAEFDHVIIDAPPALEFADARTLARAADGVILILRAGRSDKNAAAATMDQLLRDGARIPGIILNAWPASRREYPYRRYRRVDARESAAVAFAGAAPRRVN